jgi:sugar lactone lactonase YvrE
MKITLTKLVPAAIILLALPVLSANAGEKFSPKAEKAFPNAEKPFPHVVEALDGSYPEGFAIGKGHTAYNGSVDGSIYKMDLRSGKGEVLVPVQDPFGCSKLGMRVDSRTNYLFVAGCEGGNVWVFDADTGEAIGPEGGFILPLPDELPIEGDTLQIVNDLTITKDAVYLTDSHQPLLYQLPLSKNGGLPAPDAATAILLPDEFNFGDYCCGANGIVSTPNGKTLIVGNSWTSQLLRVDLSTGDMDEILVDPPLRGTAPWTGFIDGFALQGKTLYIMTPADFPDDPDDPYYPEDVVPVLEDWIQVVQLDPGMFTGALVGKITDPDNLDFVASGALFGKSLYVNNARYLTDREEDPANWVTRLNRHAVEPVE